MKNGRLETRRQTGWGGGGVEGRNAQSARLGGRAWLLLSSVEGFTVPISLCQPSPCRCPTFAFLNVPRHLFSLLPLTSVQCLTLPSSESPYLVTCNDDVYPTP